MYELIKFLYGIKTLLPLLVAFVSAFFGALFAFYVSQLNERLKRNRRRWVIHWNALVKLQHVLNDNLGIVAENRDKAKKAINSISNNNSIYHVVWIEPQLLPRESESLTELLRVTLINDIYSYDVMLRKINNDTVTICAAYSEPRSLFLSNEMNPKRYHIDLQEFCNGLKLLNKAYSLIDNRTMQLLAKTRAIMKKDELISKKSMFFSLPVPHSVSGAEIEKEMSLILEEIKAIQEKSRKEIDEYLS